MTARICLVTTGQPSTNPRLVKEADALAAAGHQVHVVGAHWADWADEYDRAIVARARWTMTLVDWRRAHAPVLFHKTRVRHWMARRLADTPLSSALPREAALSRVGPELRKAAARVSAGLYIAHNLGALPAALAAAKRHRALVGFDAEDFHSGQLQPDDPMRKVTEEAERALLPACSYVTAASPGIAAAYERLCGIRIAATVLNVFSLTDRPAQLRPTDPSGPLRMYWFSQTIGPGRGLEDAVAAMGLLGTTRIELHLRGRWQAGYESELRALAQRSGVTESQIVAHPPAPPDDMVRCAAEYDVGLALEPPVSQNNDLLLSNKTFTYLLAGSAVAMTKTTGQAALLPRLGRAAVAYDPGSAASLAAALEAWLNDRAVLDDARKAAWALGDGTFNWEREQTRFLDVVNQALSGAERAA